MAHAAGVAVMAGLWQRIKTVALTDVGVLVKGLDRDALDHIEQVLIEADFGPAAFEMAERLEQRARRGELRTEQAMRTWLTDEIAAPLSQPNGTNELLAGVADRPAVVMFLGVNGVGKTTQLAKVAHRLGRAGRSVLLAAADTYRAGASEQLQVWATRLGVPCVTGSPRGDPAAVAFDAVEAATARGIDVVLVDTAGRLHTQGDLMQELQKIARVVGRRCPGAPHETLLVLDGTVGQNAIHQGRAFTDAVPVTGLVITKLDGTAKGGAAASIRRELGVPIRFIGVGEGLDDLEVFDARRFAERVLAD
ncbi:MAG TPA: signal recognition particle-docking protein FtsY [Gemmatimonadales bacterium]